MTRKTILTLALVEGLVLWLTVVGGVALADNLGRASEAAVLMTALGRGFAFAVVCVIGLYLADLYDIATLRRASAFPQRLPRALGVALCLLGVLYTLMPDARLNVRALLPSAVVAVVLLFGVRAVLGRAVRRGQPERVLVLGEGPLAARVVAAVDGTDTGVRGEHIVVGVVGIVGDELVGGHEKLDEALESGRPDRIVVAALNRQVLLPLRQLLDGRLHGIAVEDWVPFYERLAGKIALESLTPGSVAFGDGFGEPRLHAAFARAVGLLAALIGAIVVAPFLLLAILAIRLTSPGPVFFVQQRVGRFGRPYGLIKLRTMRVSTDAHSEWAQDNKLRITPIGGWLRRFRIDELPQLINVIKGDMNIVGPRPHPVSNYLLFMARIPHYAQRSVVRPGITGWAQIRYGYANNLEQEIEKMCFDLFYIRNVSIWLDLQVLIETARVVARGHEGADAAMVPVQSGLSGHAT
jgi:exopolysaccharide biosynthesis polyprenyl glycosylphosphotransferase